MADKTNPYNDYDYGYPYRIIDRGDGQHVFIPGDIEPKAKVQPEKVEPIRHAQRSVGQLDPLATLLLSMVEGPSQGIETTEKIAQGRLVYSTTLPTKHNDAYDKPGETRRVLEAAGVVFGEVEKNDDMFQQVTLPEGWGKRPTDHYLWSDLCDDKNRKRASIFYKGASYDRDAFMSAVRRFRIESDLKLKHSEEKYRMQVLDGDTVLFSTEAVEIGRKDYATQDRVTEEQRKEATAWLAERYPNWQDPAAHWDDP